MVNEDILVCLLYIFCVVPVLIYIGVQRAGTPELLFKGLLALGCITFLYHSYRLYTKWRAGSSSLWIDLVYLTVVAIPFLWIGYYEKEASRQAYEMLLLLGFGTLGYNIYTLVLHLSTVTGGKDAK